MTQPTFTSLNIYLCNKELRVQITINRWESESGRFVDCEPLSFSLKAPAFHRPCELNFHIKSTTKDFRNIFSKGLLESFLLLKVTKAKWKKVINDYECYLERSNDAVTRQLDKAVEQNDLSGQVVGPPQPISSSMVTGTTKVISTKSSESSKFTKNEDVKGSLMKPLSHQSIVETTNPLSSSPETSDNVNASSEHSLFSQQQERLDFVTSIQRQTETFSNVTASKSNSVVSSIVTISHSSSQHLALSKPLKSNSIPTGSAKSEQAKLDSKKISKTKDVKLTKIKRHTLHCFLHGMESITCIFYDTPEECHDNFDQAFADGLKQLLGQKASANFSNNDEQVDEYISYIWDHLQHKICPSTCDLWRFCISKQYFKLLKFADEGLLIHSEIKAEKIGTICKEYFGYKNMPVIGKGGFGKVYKYNLATGDKRALKDEIKQPIITGNPELFQCILSLKHENLIQVLEYVVGPYDKNTGERSFLCVMPFINQRDLDKQFNQKSSLKCVLDYMSWYQEDMDFIFRNYTVVFKHVFNGLCFLERNRIIHRDVKISNILVHQNCSCISPLLCKCPGNGGVVYMLSDLDLLCFEEDTLPDVCTCEVWNKMVQRDPAGTVGMKPPEAFFKTGEGERVITHKSDVWSGCVTMMNVLIGKGANIDPQIQISNFLKAATKNAITASHGINESSMLLDKIKNRFNKTITDLSIESTVLNNEMDGLNNDLKNLKQLLSVGKSCLQRMQSFQGIQDHNVYHEENPLAGILTTFYGVNSLHWKCLSKLPFIYNTPLWVVMQGVLDIIVSGVKFDPEHRRDAGNVLDAIRVVYNSVFKIN